MPMQAIKEADPPAAPTVPIPDQPAALSGTASRTFEDPLDEDAEDDALVVASRRGLIRMALIAAETGARFQRERVQADPMAWMLAPRRMFDGRTAVEACLERDACVRALLLHGLGMDLDAAPDELDELAADDGTAWADADDPVLGGADGIGVSAGGDVPAGGRGAASGIPGSRPCASTAVAGDGDGNLRLFHAAVVGSGEGSVERPCRADGGAAVDEADVSQDSDPRVPTKRALVSRTGAEALAPVANVPSSTPSAGLRVPIRRRFDA